MHAYMFFCETAFVLYMLFPFQCPLIHYEYSNCYNNNKLYYNCITLIILSNN